MRPVSSCDTPEEIILGAILGEFDGMALVEFALEEVRKLVAQFEWLAASIHFMGPKLKSGSYKPLCKM
jgi:hypothetical protein